MGRYACCLSWREIAGYQTVGTRDEHGDRLAWARILRHLAERNESPSGDATNLADAANARRAILAVPRCARPQPKVRLFADFRGVRHPVEEFAASCRKRFSAFVLIPEPWKASRALDHSPRWCPGLCPRTPERGPERMTGRRRGVIPGLSYESDVELGRASLLALDAPGSARKR